MSSNQRPHVVTMIQCEADIRWHLERNAILTRKFTKAVCWHNDRVDKLTKKLNAARALLVEENK